tara:strand:+ start:360 stop:674 length:315 start_codon:yes stop_codon:yes gene_type:complete
MNYNSMWPQERTDKLLSLKAKGLDYNQISVEMKISRNAVIGKLNRIKIKNGYVSTRSYHRKRRYISKAKCIGSRPCNICGVEFNIASTLQRFCEPCKTTSFYRY